MTYRGRLIFPFIAEIERLDTGATANTTVGTETGFDRIFREPVTNAAGVDARQYTAVRLQCQVATESGPYREQTQLAPGRDLHFDVQLAVHYEELETIGLVDPTTRLTVLQPSDRLVAIYRRDNTLQVRYPEPLYCVQVQDRSWGLSSGFRNLVKLYFVDRKGGVE